jgi:hypothetical protein
MLAPRVWHPKILFSCKRFDFLWWPDAEFGYHNVGFYKRFSFWRFSIDWWPRPAKIV